VTDSTYEKDADGYIILTPTLAKVARETLADVVTPGGSFGVVSKVKNGYVWVDVSSPQSDEVGDHQYEMSAVSVNPETVEYWRRQGYID